MLKKKNLWRGLTMVFALLLAVSMMAGNILELYRTSVDAFLGTRSTQTVTEQSDDESDAWTYKSEFTTAKEAYEGFKDFAIETSQETFALLKNENGALPLAKDAKITMLGVRSYAPVYGNSGGSVPDGKSTVQIFDAFTERGFQLNPETLAAYEAFFADKEWTKPQFGGGILPAYAEITAYDDPHELTLDELKQLNPDFESKYTEYGDAAIVVVGRVGGEGGAYYPGEEGLADGVNTVNGNILSLSDEEMAMIEEAKANFDKVIVLVNAANPMEIANLQDDPDIDAILWVGYPGAYGFYAVADVLNGTVAPSAHLGDTFVKNGALAPAMQNFGNIPWANASDFAEGTSVNSYLIETEGIYTGYRYYETRYEDKVLGQGNAGDYNYADAVMYPFGYGLSYTDFEWSDYDTSWDGDTCTVTVKVTNTGDVAGKDVVQVYAQSPYTDYDKANKVEKAAVELVGYAKTAELAPGASETVTVTFDQEQLKSYDYVNAKTYILDAGDYYITAAKNAHEAVNNILSAKGKTVADGMTSDGDTAFVATYTPANGTVDTTTYKLDTTTGVEITNQLDHANGDLQYLSRNDWTGTWPTTDGEVSDQISTWGNDINGTDANGNPASYTYYKTISNEDLAQMDSFDSLNPTDPSTLTDEIVYGKDNGLGLIDMRGLDYNDPKWDDLLDQLTPSDYQTLITQSGYGTSAIKSVDKPAATDRDAATGLVNYGFDASGNFVFTRNIEHCGVIVLAQTYNDELATHYGENIGDESYYLDVDGWYAPAVNMHRTAFSGRNSEYYSEDPFVGGHIASLECKGVASRGMYVFVKHYAINDQEDHRGDREGQYSIATFLNEQAAREIYLKPFEMCVKADTVEMNYVKDNGDGTYSNATTEIPSVTGVMTSFNRVGYTWAGGNYNLVTGLLRNEWGFHGFIITDNANTGVFMDAGQMIQAGADGKLTNLPSGARYTFNKDDVSDYHYGREAIHNILYTVANSKAMNGGMPGSRYLAKIEPYQKVIYAVDGICGSLIAVLVVLTILRFRKKKEDVKTV